MINTLNRIERELNGILSPSCHKVKISFTYINKKQGVLSVMFTVFEDRGATYTFVQMPKVKFRPYNSEAEDREREDRLYNEQFSSFKKALEGYVEQ